MGTKMFASLLTSRNDLYHQQCWPESTAIDPLYMDMDDPIPPEDRADAPTVEIDAERIASRDPEAVIRKNRHLLAGSFNEWMRQTFLEEEAARKIQQFVRPRLPNNGSILLGDKNRNTSTTLSFLSVNTEEEFDDDGEQEQFDVFLWHGSHLGLEFYSCDLTGFPCVANANGNDTLPGMWNIRQGDYLVSINDCSTHVETMPYDSVVEILEDGVRPAILRFRRPRLHELRFRSSITRMVTPRAPISNAKKELQQRRERLERSLVYVVWKEEDGPLGIVLKPDRSIPYPTVSEVNQSGVVARETQRNSVKAGDLLLSINHMDVSTMGYRQSLEIMKFAPRPLVLTFRRSTPTLPVGRSLEL